MITLQPFRESDYERLINWIDSEYLMYVFSATIFRFPITKSQLDEYTQQPNRVIYKVMDTNSNEIIGHAELNNINKRSKSARICRVLVGSKKARNKGYGTLIVNELVRVGFEEMNLHRIDLGVYDFNKNAIKCYQKCGFKIEGLLIENTKIGSKYWSTYNMSIINKNYARA
ncbi:GNAT family N-acetyltransferase [Polaribacter sp.]|uniref:GNAT family N-acetyltransferase n=1 Tax=Polaribacter sp. TaxID=1920175 RepID=UPI003F6C761E